MVPARKSSAVRQGGHRPALLCNASKDTVRMHRFCVRNHVHYFSGKFACNIAGRRFWPLPPRPLSASAPFLESARRKHDSFPKMLDRDRRHRGRIVADRACARAGTCQAAQHRRHHGRRHRHVEHRRLPPRHDGRAARRTSTRSPRKACCSPTTTPRRVARRVARTSSPAMLPIRTGMTTVGQAGVADRPARRGGHHRDGAEVAWATPPASSARTTWATRTSSCRPSTASTNSSATSITSMRWKTRRIPTIRRTC